MHALKSHASVTAGSLPFTGFPLWIAALIAMTLVVAGLGIRRLARATV